MDTIHWKVFQSLTLLPHESELFSSLSKVFYPPGTTESNF
jgi:hypothetical protein